MAAAGAFAPVIHPGHHIPVRTRPARSSDPRTAVCRHYCSYDPAGNRTAEQIDDAVSGASYNNMNQLVTQQAGGALEDRLLNFQSHYQAVAKPFQWRFTRPAPPRRLTGRGLELAPSASVQYGDEAGGA